MRDILTRVVEAQSVVDRRQTIMMTADGDKIPGAHVVRADISAMA